MTIGKVFKAGVKNVARKGAQVTTEKVGQKVGEMVVDKGADKIQQFCESTRHRMQKRNVRKFCKTECQKKLYQRTLCRN